MALLAEFSIDSLKTEHASRVMAKVIETLESAGLHYHLGPISITVEGTWEQMQEAIRRCHQLVALNHGNQPNFPEMGLRDPVPVEKWQLRADRND
jgi:uncharacterized protein YqgV (UPF0045/DUF77 family)